MADQVIKATVVVIDKASGPWNNVAKALQRITADARTGARMMTHEFKALNEAMKPAVGTMNLLSPALSAFGISALSVTGIVGGLALGLQRLAEQRTELGHAAASIGLTTDALKAAQSAGELFHIPAETMTVDLKTFSRLMQEVANGTPEGREFIDWLIKQRGWGPRFAADFMEAAKAGDVSKGLALAADQLDRFKDPTTKDLFGEKVFGDPAMGRLKNFNKEMATVSNSTLKLTEQQQADLEKLDRYWIQLQTRLWNYRDYLLAQLGPTGQQVFKMLDEKMQAVGKWIGEHPDILSKFFFGDDGVEGVSKNLDTVGRELGEIIKGANTTAEWLNYISTFGKTSHDELSKGLGRAPVGSVDEFGRPIPGLDPLGDPAEKALESPTIKEGLKSLWRKFWQLNSYQSGGDGGGGGGGGGGDGNVEQTSTESTATTASPTTASTTTAPTEIASNTSLEPSGQEGVTGDIGATGPRGATSAGPSAAPGVAAAGVAKGIAASATQAWKSSMDWLNTLPPEYTREATPAGKLFAAIRPDLRVAWSLSRLGQGGASAGSSGAPWSSEILPPIKPGVTGHEGLGGSFAGGAGDDQGVLMRNLSRNVDPVTGAVRISIDLPTMVEQPPPGVAFKPVKTNRATQMPTSQLTGSPRG